MFTGLIEETGRAVALEPRGQGLRLTVDCRLVVAGAAPGDSIAVNGVCLTATELTSDGFTADLAPETLARTNLGDLTTGSIVNLERPVLASGRFGGHIVQGHVDGTAVLKSLQPLGSGDWWLTIDLPSDLERYCVWKGSIAIDGISITIARLEGTLLSVAIIPHTYNHTALRGRRSGDRLNIEVDLLAKYVEKLLSCRRDERITPA